ncbi:DMT family transporter [Devosia rhodophyticola]|uniref:DMT family transporter n=1 Tax=Devosia rhodophyticola TaxID=3026423 RepID=A0ABY7YUB5_9HYPH|nr:DMT family transporter [Devosia rhodophyticola]WDR04940.1 DMT family transporter [Devosia rhodophyticola]
MTKPPSPPNRGISAQLLDRPYVLLILTTLFWGGNVVAGKLAVGHIDPYTLTLLRWTGALLIVLPFSIRPLKRDMPTLLSKWWLLLFYGGVGYVTFNIFIYIAAHYASGINIGLEQVTINMFVMLANFALFGLRVRALQLFGVALTALGVLITATHGDLARLLSLDIGFGDLLVLFACAAYAAYSVTLRFRPVTSWLSYLVATFMGAIIASIFYQLALGGGIGAFFAALPTISPQGWLVAAYTMLLPSVVSQMFYVRGVELIGANRASLFINLIPIFAASLAILVLGETLQPYHMVAAALVMAGIFLAEFSARRALKSPLG